MDFLVSSVFRRVKFASGLMEIAELPKRTGNCFVGQSLAAQNHSSIGFHTMFKPDTLLLVTLEAVLMTKKPLFVRVADKPFNLTCTQD